MPRYDTQQKDPAHIFTPEEIEFIFNRFRNSHTVYYAFLTAYYTGLRISEVFGLTWEDIDFEKKIIKINKTVYAKDNEENGRWYLGATKTLGSSRVVYICDILYAVLSDYKKLQVKYKEEYGKKIKDIS